MVAESNSFLTGKSVSEALILESVNPQYDDILFIDLQLQYKKNTSSEHVVYKNCFLFLFWHSKQFLYTTVTVNIKRLSDQSPSSGP